MSVLQRIARELRKLATSPLDGINVIVNEEDLTDIQAEIAGPAQTPYEGGVFRCKLVLSNDFPNTPPRGFFLTKIFHPNVSANGDICVNTLKRDWDASLGMSHILQVIRCLLIIPFPESALNEDASKLFLESYDDYFKRARLMTSIHAMRKCAAGSGSSSSSREIAIETKEKENASGGADASMTSRPAVKPKLTKKKSERKKNLKRL
ncbi:Ubiquitin-conjugating enzyme E2 S [Hondaea fermentalgiana]|uniref:E2 ubiquitin-conjugating enzyme n=1 Tax=Hondaea fermentalgiana TaxID=2315210 RepID=A0A2R5GBJ3_9STRA|nr:Ubiquitin-conjugating enzyme E2 S [Hondaea fermentalgiana]|eukprot:GBG25953.1 Ubiquitin-conjugating enzyme E2 S [Hondaea fermentalgiana]